MLKIICIIILILATLAFAGSNGGYAGAYLRMGLGARAIALGNTGVAQDASAYSIYYNPAAFGRTENHMLGLSYSFLSLDRRFAFLSTSFKIPPAGGFSMGLIESGVNNLKSYNSIGQETGQIIQRYFVLYFSFARQFNKWISAGLSYKTIWEKISSDNGESLLISEGFGFDFGLQFYLSNNLTLGYQLKNIDMDLKAHTTENIFPIGSSTVEKFPIINTIGAFYRTSLEWLRCTYEFEWSNKESYLHHFGVEALHGKNLALRGGYNGKSLTFGAGMDFQILKKDAFLDYAFLPSVVDEGSSHIFSWQLIF